MTCPACASELRFAGLSVKKEHIYWCAKCVAHHLEQDGKWIMGRKQEAELPKKPRRRR